MNYKCWQLTDRCSAGSFKGIGIHSAAPTWTWRNASLMAIVLSINLEFQLSFLYSEANYHRPHEKQHWEIVPFLFLVIICPPAAIIAWDITRNHQEKVDGFMRNSYGTSVNQSITVSGKGKAASCRTEFLPPTGRRKSSFSKKLSLWAWIWKSFTFLRIGSIFLGEGLEHCHQ